jgi:hypothetical protein
MAQPDLQAAPLIRMEIRSHQHQSHPPAAHPSCIGQLQREPGHTREHDEILPRTGKYGRAVVAVLQDNGAICLKGKNDTSLAEFATPGSNRREKNQSETTRKQPSRVSGMKKRQPRSTMCCEN